MPVPVGGHYLSGVAQRGMLRRAKAHGGRENAGKLQQQGDLTRAAALEVQLLLVTGQEALAGLVVEGGTMCIGSGQSRLGEQTSPKHTKAGDDVGEASAPPAADRIRT